MSLIDLFILAVNTFGTAILNKILKSQLILLNF